MTAYNASRHAATKSDELARAEGICINWRWTWVLDGKSVTRQVNRALKLGQLKGVYYRGGKASLQTP